MTRRRSFNLRTPEGNLAAWDRIQRAFGNRCAYCCATDRPLTRDHWIPKSRGGVGMLVPACEPCNVRKGDQLPADLPWLPAARRMQIEFILAALQKEHLPRGQRWSWEAAEDRNDCPQPAPETAD